MTSPAAVVSVAEVRSFGDPAARRTTEALVRREG